MRSAFESVSIVALSCLVLCSCAGEAIKESQESQTSTASHVQQILSKGTLVMLCFPVQESSFVAPRLDVLRERGVPLTEVRDADAYEGTDVDMIRGFADSLGVTLEIHAITTTYGNLIQAVVDGVGDLAASSLTVTEAREEIIDFSDPVNTIWAVVAGTAATPIESLDDLAGSKIRGMTGSSQVDLFLERGPPEVELSFGDYSLDNYLAVTEGEVDYMLMDSNAEVGEPASEDYPDVEVVFRLADTNYGVAFPDGSDLRQKFNEYLASRSAASE